MAYSQQIAKYGNAAQQAGMQIQKRNSINRLMELEQNRGQRADADASFGPGRTSISGATDYFNRLNEEGEMAGIQNTLAGRKPQVSHSYGGTDFAEGDSMPRPRPSLNALEGGPSDNLDYFSRLAHVQGQNVQNERQRDAEFEQSTQDDPYFAARRRATTHAAIVDEAGARGEGEAESYLAPGQDDKRRQQRWDDEAYGAAVGPYSPASIRGQTELNKQKIIADRESQKALYGYEGRIGGQAIRSFGGVAAAEANQGRDVTAQRNEIGSRMPGAAGAAADKTATMEQIAQVAQSRGIPVEDLARYYESQGYVISGGR